MNKAARMISAALAAVVAPLAGGCVSGLRSHQPVQQQYVLALPLPGGAHLTTGPAGATNPADAGSTLQVLLPLASAGLGTDGIAVMRPGQRLDYYSGARWAASAPVMLQSMTIQALRRKGHFALVEPQGGPFDARYVLSLTLTHFEADYSGAGPPTVRVALVCTLGRRADRTVAASFTVRSAVMANADRMQAVVAAFERASAAALVQLAARLAPPSKESPQQSTATP